MGSRLWHRLSKPCFQQKGNTLNGHCLSAFHRELQAVIERIGFDCHVVAVQHFAIEDLDSERILHEFLQRAFERARAIRAVVAREQELVLRALGHLKRDAAVREQVLHIFKPQADDVRELLFVQRAEQHDVIDAVQELRAEVLLQHFGDVFTRKLPAVFVFERFSVQQVRAQFEVMMRTVFLKSTVRPFESVKRPSSSTWSSTLKTSGCAFSISSNRMTA